MLTSIDVKFIFDSACLGLFRCRPLELSSCCSCHLFSFLVLFRLVLTLETSEMSIFVFTTCKTTQPPPQIFSVNDALTCKEAAILTSSVD